MCESLNVGAGGDVTRKIDLLAEDIFIKHLSCFGKIDSEESGLVGSGEYRIVLDPLDGSDNFLSQIPYYGSSLALELNGMVLVGVVCNFASGDIFIKTSSSFLEGDLRSGEYKEVGDNPCFSVGLFERAYRSCYMAPRLFKHKIRYRSLGASALSFAYAHRVAFVIFEGSLREYDSKAGLFMCENLYKYEYNGVTLISKDIKQFEMIKNILLEDLS